MHLNAFNKYSFDRKYRSTNNVKESTDPSLSLKNSFQKTVARISLFLILGFLSAQICTVTDGLMTYFSRLGFSSVQFSCSVVSDSLRPHEYQHARPTCPSPTPGIHSNSCPLCRWCHPAISSSVVPFSSCPQSLPASGSFPMSQLFISGGQSTGVSALALVLPMNTQDWSPL